MIWILRLLGKMPRGRFEYTCGICGHYEITCIPKDENDVSFNCGKCGAIIRVWEQRTHWHMTITCR